MADILPYPNAGGDVASEDTTNDFYNGPGGYGNNPAASTMYNNNQGQQQRPRYPGLYVGNLTWWTTDRDVIDAINSIGVEDVQEVKFFENRNNGQSKGFCVVTFTSETSLPLVMDKLPTKELHGQNPVVSPYNRQNLHLFENQNKPRPMINSNGPITHGAGIMGINSITGVHAAAAAANAQVAAATAVAANIPYTNVTPTVGAQAAVGLGYNQTALGMNSLAGAGGPRPFMPPMRMQMRGHRPMSPYRASMMGQMNGQMAPMAGGHQMMRPRQFMSNWANNNQGGYTNTVGRPQMNSDISNRLGVSGGGGGGTKQDDSGSDMMRSSSYHNTHHSNSQSDHYRSDTRDHRDHRDIRDERDVRRFDDGPLRLDDRSRYDERARDDRSSKQDDRIDRSRRDDRSSRKLDDDRSSRRSDERRDRDDRSSRREEKSSSRHHRERSHRSDDRGRSRSRSKDRSRDGKSDRRDRDRDRDRERDRRERY